MRHEALAFTGRGDRLRRLDDLLRSAGAGALWRGTAQQAYAASVSEQLPSLDVAANRYDFYAVALRRYADAVDEIEPELRWLRRVLSGLLATPASAERDTALRTNAARFADAHGRWGAALDAVCASLRQSGDDSLRDPHGVHLLLARLDHALKYADPVGYLMLHPSLASLSNCLNIIGTELTVLGVALLFVCPPAAAACLAVATVLSAAQFAVDATRRGRGEHVSMAVLGLDAFGALPIVGREAKEAEEVSKAAEELAPSERKLIELVPGGGLQQHEGLEGGHVLAKHSGRSSGYITDRLDREPQLSEASTFFDRATAEQAISDTLKDNAATVRSWLAGPNSQLTIVSHVPYSAGFLMARGKLLGTTECGVRVVLRRSSALGIGYRVHTAMVVR